MPVFEIVASAENNRYMEWQAMLFHFSCTTVQGQVPVIAVHKGEEPLLPGFEIIKAHGGRVQTVPNLRHLNNIPYPPRNSAAALGSVETDADYVVLCDADMVFCKPVPFASLELDRNTITFDHIGFLDPDHPDNQPHIDDVFRANGVDPPDLRRAAIDGAVPHIVSSQIHATVGAEWLRCIDLFPILFEEKVCPDPADPRYENWPFRCYLASMWAIILATHRLRLRPLETHWCMTNCYDTVVMPEGAGLKECLLHYAYGSSGFNKRNVADKRQITDPEFWSFAADDGTIAGFLRRQMAAAGAFYSLV